MPLVLAGTAGPAGAGAFVASPCRAVSASRISAALLGLVGGAGPRLVGVGTTLAGVVTSAPGQGDAGALGAAGSVGVTNLLGSAFDLGRRGSAAGVGLGIGEVLHAHFFHLAALRAKLACFFVAPDALDPGLRAEVAFCCTVCPLALALAVNLPTFAGLILMAAITGAPAIRRNRGWRR